MEREAYKQEKADEKAQQTMTRGERTNGNNDSDGRGKEWKDLAMRLKKLHEDRDARESDNQNNTNASASDRGVYKHKVRKNWTDMYR